MKDEFRDSTLSKGAFSKFARGLKKKSTVADKIKAQLEQDAIKRKARDQPRCSRALALEASPAFVDGVCIVTGASAGIGAALCEALACELKVSVWLCAARGRLEAGTYW